MTVIKEYEETGSLKDSTRRLMVNIIVAHMREKEGSRVSKATKEFHALGIVSRFPALKDPYSNKGYEHFYDIQSNKGFLEWRLKTVQRQSRTASSSLKKVVLKGGPTSSRPTVVTTGDQQTGDDCMEAISLLNHTTDRDLVFHKMRDTFQYRQQILHNPQHSADVLQIFPRFLDIRLILQDFSLMFGEETASRFLRKWNTSFKDKITQEAKNLKETSLLKRHLRSALNEGSDTTDDPDRNHHPSLSMQRQQSPRNVAEGNQDSPTISRAIKNSGQLQIATESSPSPGDWLWILRDVLSWALWAKPPDHLPRTPSPILERTRDGAPVIL
ncbi:uncharacterized protein LOC115786549 [Archocentrus centrarchus]|uniref:uncharacterized protein LOC115786549 n=1 Tax=Archocentrus centrarchus TaxID=63155 RepID=UPI0011EA4367|nr:uncharacterized protein LOC115786549 [Archocentrus centrarchus]